MIQGDKYSPFLHDAVLLYALALSAVIKSGGDATDGATVVSNMRGRVFSGVSGKVVLDDNGDREPDFWITDMDPKTGAFVKVAEVINYDLGVRVSVTSIRRGFSSVPTLVVHFSSSELIRVYPTTANDRPEVSMRITATRNRLNK